MAHAQLRGDAVASLIAFQAPEQAPRRKAAPQRDFAKENMRAVKDIARARRAAGLRAVAERRAKPDPFKLKRFTVGVESKVGPLMARPSSARMSADKQSRLFSALRQSEQELCAELLTLPLASDAPKVVRRRAELEGRLAEVQEAAAVFAGDVVFEDVEQLDDAEAGGSAGDHRRARQVRDAGRLASVGSQL
ncbi:hypothetical protein FNF29_03530 [Cafeteria roenbergensis]|uniref:Enkurin domain-containing protein n=1 Tax=Cafeteria roenbergensis TaxID=33653 RepID=A0A5A8CLN0_CAFRO|nr:hypothetical protein FNF29_03530 [Cafeteria roenbergensis]|eukprot:KAA0153010.1 hypothetical protein FNF29_03530 [Cafeteria roenbergensis]